ncbi:hypothetical protein GCM10011360_38260 [Primorskyibacter flagellatus]|uniref:Flagellar export protein FliJ n=1 Tax=Primorskyibacter flagellatus TaxID=1387277 RepID=A0A917EKF0_9RHOB|nr:hypothetical protein [Primorskyibacter flagellatus]GGE47377.1 hypothetical protein GCM10011360_38260 [Primorskyibacter flagellatus]
MTGQFRDLFLAVDTVYQARQAHMRRLTDDAAALRNELEDLDRQLRDSLDQSSHEATPWRAIGADQTWRAWLMRRRGALNIRLAGVLADLEDAREALKQAFARRQACHEILADEARKLRRRANRVR